MRKQTKQLGSWGLVIALIGSLLSAVGPLALIGLAGWIVALIAYFRASEELGEPDIKGNVLKAIIAGVVALLLFVFGGGAMVINMFSHGSVFSLGFLTILFAWVLVILASWFWYKANRLLSEKTGVGLFKTGGLLMFIGSILAVVIIGGFVSLVGEILLIVAWFNSPESQA